MKKEKKRKISFTECPRCGERHIDDPWYEHKCANNRGLMAFIDQATKPMQTTCSTTALTARDMEHAHRMIMERELSMRTNSYEEYARAMERYQREVERRRLEIEDMYRRRVAPPNTEWRNRIFRGASAGLSEDARDARDYQVFYDEATS